MMRIIAALIALLCCSAEGYRRSARLRSRVKFLSEIVQMLNNFSIEIRCSALTVDELMQRENGRFARLFAQCREQHGSARTAWESACGMLTQKCEETALLCELGRSLGTSDRAGQLQLLELYSERFSELRRTADAACSKKAEAIFRVGVLIGIAAAVMII